MQAERGETVMATFTGGMFGRVRAVLGLAPVAPPPAPAEGAPRQAEREAAQARTALQRDLEARRARYLREVQAAQAERAAMEATAQAAERARQAQAREDILEAIARNPAGVYWPGEYRRREPTRGWLGRVLGLFGL
jgi:hypothetical protein